MRVMWVTPTTSDDGDTTITRKQGNLDANKVIKRLNMSSIMHRICEYKVSDAEITVWYILINSANNFVSFPFSVVRVICLRRFSHVWNLINFYVVT